MVEIEESCSEKRKNSQGNEATHNSSRTSVLTKLLIIVHRLAHKSAHSTQKDLLYPFMPTHNTGS